MKLTIIVVNDLYEDWLSLNQWIFEDLTNIWISSYKVSSGRKTEEAKHEYSRCLER